MKLPALFLAIFATAVVPRLSADEGMWLFTAPPRAQLEAKYGFAPDAAWMGHLMHASVRFNNGGSGSFISADGLVITNHHVGLDSMQKLSTGQKNYARDGFYAPTRAEEPRCLDLELNVLQSIEDVTARVDAAVPAGATGDAAAKARRAAMAAIEKESLGRTGLRSDVVTLYDGGAYQLYRYKRYTDVRLVFAPEMQTAFYGGDPDNFEYPRYCLDCCVFRAYENGKPVRPADWLRWSAAGPRAGELVFVSGHPGRSDRLLAVSELDLMRDEQLPYVLSMLKRREVLLSAWSTRSDENARRAREELFGVQNSRKVLDGMLATLQDPAFNRAKDSAEGGFRQRLAGAPGGQDALAAYRRIEAAQRAIARDYLRYRMLEGSAGGLPGGFDSDSFAFARTLLRAGAEYPKPNGDRLKEFGDARRASLELELFSAKPIYTDLEILKLGDSLTDLTERLGYDDPTVRAVMGGLSPRARAAEAVLGTRVREVAFRRKLFSGGGAAVALAAGDPMIAMARVIDEEARSLRETMEAQDEIKQEAHAAIGRARYALEGPGTYPDATFTLRLSYGVVKGYEEDGESVPAFTTMAGLYRRAADHRDRPPFDLAPRWTDKEDALNLTTPFDFVCTCDIIGGNSGSPIVNRRGQFVGIIFDGNIHSLGTDFAYDDRLSRAIGVDSAAITEALRRIYGAGALADEITRGSPNQ